MTDAKLNITIEARLEALIPILKGLKTEIDTLQGDSARCDYRTRDALTESRVSITHTLSGLRRARNRLNRILRDPKE